MLNSLSLNGAWKIRWTDGQRGRSHFANRDKIEAARYLDATVPGEVHLDLMRQGVIADVYRDTNVLAARWVEQCIWSYRREFHVTPEMLGEKHVWLNFQQLDLVASVVLNGQEVGTHNNVFYPCRLDVTGKLRPGTNVLTVHLDSGQFWVADKPWEGFDTGIDGKLHKRHWLRKPQSSFSWDWAPRLINIGITGDVHLEWTDSPLRVDQLVPLVTLSDDLATGHAIARIFIENLTTGPVRATITATIAGQAASTEIEAKPGLHPYEVKLTVNQPELWWPVGHGAAKLYDLAVTVQLGDQPIAQRLAKVGFRHVRVNQDKHPVAGRYFIIEINRKPIFCKGGNFIPADMIYSRPDRARYDKLTDLALEANFNLLRIWGGGKYETDDFYELCDAKGILVWQEFIFACSKYPVINQEFNENVKAEARHNIRRLARHPSLIVWCGNNEMEMANWDWGYDKGVVLPDYSLFHLTLPRLMGQEDPTRYYQPSSPFSPYGRPPGEYETGDQHPWFLGFFDTDYRKYRPIEPRFPNEGGCMGPTSLPTMLACLPEGQRYPHSFAWQVHDNAISMWEEPSPIDVMIDLHIGRDVNKMSVEEYTFRGGLVQAEALKEYCDAFRHKMFNCASAIFWMYNDTWPCTRSWTIVDYYLRRTPSFWSVKRSMQPVNVILSEEGDQIIIYGVNESLQAITADLRYGIFHLAGGLYPMDEKTQVLLPPNTSTKVATFPKTEWPNPNTSLAFATLMQGDTLIARNRLILPLLKELSWPKPNVKVDLQPGRATFTSPTFAWGICLDLNGETPLPDNMFDLYPAQPYTIPWTAKEPPTILHIGNL